MQQHPPDASDAQPPEREPEATRAEVTGEGERREDEVHRPREGGVEGEVVEGDVLEKGVVEGEVVEACGGPATDADASKGPSPTTTRTLLSHHREQLRESGLNDSTIEKLGLHSVLDPEQACQMLGWAPDKGKPPTPALAIPYPETDGYVRLRPDAPRADKEGKTVKYEAPVGRQPEVYIPVTLCSAIEDPTAGLWLTEGEKKALAACQSGLPTIAGAGVYGFHDPAAKKSLGEWRLNRRLLPVLTPGREVTVVFDSDIDTNVEVAVAAARLIGMLQAVGVRAFMAFIEPGFGGSKRGLDDLVAALGGDRSRLHREIMDSRRPAAPDELLGWLASAWGRMAGPQKQTTELRRCLRMLMLEPRETQQMWQDSASKKLKISKGDMRVYLDGALGGHRPGTTAAAGSGSPPGGRLLAGYPAPPGFRIDEDGIWKTHEDRAPGLVASAPMTLASVGVDETHAHYWTFRWMDRGREREQTVPRAVASGPDLIRLAEYGAPVNTNNRGMLAMFFQRQEQNSAAPVPEERVFTQSGWHGDRSSFVLGRQVIGRPGRVYEGGGDPAHLDAQRPRGDLAVYLNLVLTVIAESPEAEAGWAAGYVGPLLRILQQRSLLLSFWGPSGSGKSAIQSLAISAWGKPDGLMLTGDASPTAIEANLARTRDLITWIDDTQQTRSSGVLDHLAYQVGGGTGRARGTASGGIRPVANWTAVAFVSGERPLLKLGAAAGAQNRTLDVKVAPIRTPGLAQQIHQTLADHHGLTGPLFIEGLLRHWLAPGQAAMFRARHREIMGKLTDQIDERASHVALLVTAAWLARVLILGQDSGGAEAAALKMGKAILELASSTADGGVHPVEAGYESILAWVAENDQFFQKQASKQYGVFVDPRDAGAGGRRVVAILHGPLLELARRDGFNLMEVLHGLLDRKLMLPGEPTDKGPRLGKKTALGDSRPRAYWIVMPGEEDPPAPSSPEGGTGEPPARGGPAPAVAGGTAKPGDGGVNAASCPTVPEVPAAKAPAIASPTPSSVNRPPSAGAEGGTGGTGGTATAGKGEGKEEDQDLSSPSSPSLGPPPLVPRAVPHLDRVGQIEVGPSLTPRWEMVTDADRVRSICEQLARHPRLALDIETFARNTHVAPESPDASSDYEDDHEGEDGEHGEHGEPDLVAPGAGSALDPFSSGVRLVQIAGEGTDQFLIDVERIGSLPEPLADILSSRATEVVGYNLAFDAKMLLHHFGVEMARPVDLYAGSVLAAGYADHRLKGHYTLQAVVRRRLGVDLPKEQARSDWSAPSLNHEQLEYAARDVAVLLPLHDHTRAAAAQAGVGRAWALENDVILPVAAMELAGFALDRVHVQRLIDMWTDDAAVAAADVIAVLGHLNLNSAPQVLKALRTHCGVNLSSTSTSALMPHAAAVPVIHRLLTYRQSSKMIGTYGKPWMDMSRRDGRLHASFHPLAAPTGRFGCSRPNIQAVPRDGVDPLTGKPDPMRSVRRAFVGSPDSDLVVADYNAIELRVLASEIGDPALTACFTGAPPICPHRRTASVVARKPIADVTSSERTAAKAVNFGFCYGMGADRFVTYARDTYGVIYTQNEARAARGAYLQTYAGVAAWHRRSRNEGPRLKEVRTASGRLRRFGQEAADFPHSQYLNTRIQGTAADGLKRAMSLLYPELKRLGAKLVNVVHDEIVLDCPAERREEAQAVLVQAMKDGMTEFVPKIPILAEVTVANTWVKP